MEHFYLYSLDKATPDHDFGGKGNSLLRLIRLGYSVPETFALPLTPQFTEQDRIECPPIPFPLIIRSSADQEDQQAQSFAGAFLSIKVNHESEWDSAVFRVMRSILLCHNPLGPSLKAGLVVQPFIETEKRGVAFSRSPQNLWDKVETLEYAVKEHSVVDGKGPTKILTRMNKALPIWCVSVLDLAQKLEEQFRTPVDIEWGVDSKGTLHLFQCRPIVGSEAEKVRRNLQNPSITWTRHLAQERFPACLTPMAWDVIEDGIPVNLQSLFDYFGLESGSARDLAFSDEGWIYHSEHFFKMPGGLKMKTGQFLKRRPLFLLQFLITLPKYFGKNGKSRWLCSLAELATDGIKRAIRKDMKAAVSLVPELKTKLSFSDLLTREALENEFNDLTRLGKTFFKADLPIFLAKDLLFKAYQSLWRSSGSDSEFLTLVSRLPKNISMDIFENKDDLAFARRTWDIYYSASDELKNLIQAHVLTKQESAPPLSSLWRKKIHRLQEWMTWDEELHHYTGLFLEATREVLLACGRRMVEEKTLEMTEDIFFLHLKEAKAFLADSNQDFSHYARLAQHRKRIWLKRRTETPDGFFPPQNKITPKISQTGMSSGKASGTFLFLDEESDLSKLPSTPFILVTSTANPVWITLFPRVSGWITEVGGPLSHGFVAAREWKIPAVSQFPIQKLKSLPPGTSISIDGSTGGVQW